MKPRPYQYCIKQVGKDPKIIEVQGLTWFETDDLAYEYWGHMNDEFQKSIGAISVISEENLPYFFDCNSEYIKAKLTGTRLLKSKEPVGVKVTNDQEVISEYYKPDDDIGIYMDLNDGPNVTWTKDGPEESDEEEKDLERCFPEWDLGVQ